MTNDCLAILTPFVTTNNPIPQVPASSMTAAEIQAYLAEFPAVARLHFCSAADVPFQELFPTFLSVVKATIGSEGPMLLLSHISFVFYSISYSPNDSAVSVIDMYVSLQDESFREVWRHLIRTGILLVKNLHTPIPHYSICCLTLQTMQTCFYRNFPVDSVRDIKLSDAAKYEWFCYYGGALADMNDHPHWDSTAPMKAVDFHVARPWVTK